MIEDLGLGIQHRAERLLSPWKSGMKHLHRGAGVERANLADGAGELRGAAVAKSSRATAVITTVPQPELTGG